MNVINVIEPYRVSICGCSTTPRSGFPPSRSLAGADTMIDRVTADFPEANTRGS